jgi:hypothetical protein
MAMLCPLWQTTMDEVASRCAGSGGLWWALELLRRSCAYPNMTVLGIFSNTSLSQILHYDHSSAVPANASNTPAVEMFLDAWAWIFLAINTTMTMSIILKILYVGCLASNVLL